MDAAVAAAERPEDAESDPSAIVESQYRLGRLRRDAQDDLVRSKPVRGDEADGGRPVILGRDAGGDKSPWKIAGRRRRNDDDGDRDQKRERASQVPSSHDARYFAWASVSRSIETPIVSSFSRAISSSMSVGTG